VADILIADDDADIRRLLSWVLAEQGHQVSVAKDGRSSIEAMVMSPPDIVILDLMMPEMNGLSVLKEMAEYQVLDSTKVLVLTAKGSEADREVGLELGADHYITKPADPLEVVMAVKELLALTKDELRVRREKERDQAHLLSQLESAFDQGPSGAPNEAPGQLDEERRDMIGRWDSAEGGIS
jgi:two-component system alkaline phosphatase synthesis response regulator PhoP